MSPIHYGVCSFCDSTCGLEIEYEADEIISIRGNKKDIMSRGHVCPKGLSNKELYNDPDRIRRPMRRTGDKWEEVSWEDAYDEVGRRVAGIQKEYGNDSAAVYYGNPVGHNYGMLLALIPFLKGFKTKNVYSAQSVDSLTRTFTSYFVYGSQALLPVPDIERTDFFLILGANPVVSNGSIMTAPDCKKRLEEMRERGAKIIVIDPRRTETASMADAHYFIRPGSDAFFLLAMLDTLFKEDLADPGELASKINGLSDLRGLAGKFPPERVADAVGIDADDIRSLARQFAQSASAVCYGRMGTSTQEFGGLCTWLIDAVNIVTGNFDRPGGAMFANPAVDLAGLARFLRQPGHFNTWQSRVGGLPEFNDELPVAGLADEMETPGEGQIKALIILAGNPVLSLPNGSRLDRLFEGLDFMAAIDFYINETTRHADIVLPPLTAMEEDHYSILENAMGIRNTAQYSPALFPKPRDTKHNWEIQLDLMYHVDKHRGPLARAVGGLKKAALNYFNPHRQLDLLLKLGPHKLSIDKLKLSPHGLDLGALEPMLDKVISTPDRRINLVPEVLVADLDRLEQKLAPEAALKDGELLLISRRTLRSMNTWMHNLAPLVKGVNRCTLMMHPEDAGRGGFENGQEVRVSSRTGRIAVELTVTDEMMPGVVSMAFGWGHGRPGAMLSVAGKHAGASMNDITDDALYDRASGISVLDGIPVRVEDIG